MMRSIQDITHLTDTEVRNQFGGKALGLYQAAQLRLNIPETWLISNTLFSEYLKTHNNNAIFSDSDAHDFLKKQLDKKLKSLPETTYAVRSSAQLEDDAEQSFAGIFDTRLSVKKTNIIDEIIEVWKSAFSARVKNYTDDLSKIKMAIIIQPMINTKFSGVCFSKHPSPNSVLEENDLFIEIANSDGEKIVQGEITPLQLSGHEGDLLNTLPLAWRTDIIKTLNQLKTKLKHEIDIEFAIDGHHHFILLQQRPISRFIPSNKINLTHYKRVYKRQLSCLDIELLITGCSLYLAPYLEIPVSLAHWMIMTTSADHVQELQLHEVLNETVIDQIIARIHADSMYLTRLYQRYHFQHEQIIHTDYDLFFDATQPLIDRFYAWLEWLKPINAHYYMPMFIIDALSKLLLQHMENIDKKNAQADFMQLATANVRTLHDLLHHELLSLKHSCSELPKQFKELPKQYQHILSLLCQRYGFLRLHQVYEEPYQPEDLFSLMCEIEAEKIEPVDTTPLINKYFNTQESKHLFNKLQDWMNVRNQEMEYLYYAIAQTRSLFEEISQQLAVSIEQLWETASEKILYAIQYQDNECIKNVTHKNIIIYHHQGKTYISDQLKVIQQDNQSTTQALFGTTIYGEGKETLRVKIAHKPADLKNFAPQEPYALITGMTTPDFIPYLKKQFKALITDEGGILCHAAIVAREIGLPTLVGTSLATEKFKDNDVIQIDFDNGKIEKEPCPSETTTGG